MRSAVLEGACPVFMANSWRLHQVFTELVDPDPNMQTKKIIRIFIVTAGILAIPLVAMQFTSEVNWTLSDFAIMGALLTGTGFMYELAMMTAHSLVHRLAIAIAVGAALFVTWVNLAVGIIGDNNPANLLFIGVIVVGIIGALLSRFQPRGLARTAFAMAACQALIPAIALIVWPSDFSPGVARVFLLNGCFALLFIGAGLLFLQVARKAAHPDRALA